jgi:hypothetical protein
MKYLTRISQRMSSAVASIYYMDDGYEMHVNSKCFGPVFGDTPREKDFIKAREWLEKQLYLLGKYAG